MEREEFMGPGNHRESRPTVSAVKGKSDAGMRRTVFDHKQSIKVSSGRV